MKKNLRCHGITKKGTVCKKRKCNNENYCNQHKKDCTICTICLEKCKKPKTLSCSHMYCGECISKWIYIELNMSCPNCRQNVTYYEENEMFHYCYDNNLLSKVVLNEYIINDEELIEFISEILLENSNYSANEWEIFKKYLSNSNLEQKFLNINSVSYTYYKEFNPDEEYVIENGKNVIYLYKINFI